MDGQGFGIALLEQAGKLANTLISNWPTSTSSSKKVSVPARRELAAADKPKSDIPLPTTEETIWELKRELCKQLIDVTGDLARGLLIIDKPCNCLSLKHQLEIESAAEELIPMDPGNTVYREIIDWFRDNGYKVIPEAIASGKFKDEYPKMASQFRSFRDRVGYRDERALKRLQEELGKLPEVKPETAQPLTIQLSTSKEVSGKEDLTLEEAEELAAAEARKRVRERWTEQKS